MMAARWMMAAALLVACRGNECDPGTQQPCTLRLDGGATQRGFQACTSTGLWSACNAVGTCSGAAGALPAYSRCTSMAQCGPDTCAACGHYTGVRNPEGYEVCYAYCQMDSDCAPTTPATGVTPRCVLGQCTLLCAAGAMCPRDSRCLPWATPELVSANPGFEGLCE
jgi:hypothetical protein